MKLKSGLFHPYLYSVCEQIFTVLRIYGTINNPINISIKGKIRNLNYLNQFKLTFLHRKNTQPSFFPLYTQKPTVILRSSYWII